MNCWGFTPAVFAHLGAQFREFLDVIGGRGPMPAETNPRGPERVETRAGRVDPGNGVGPLTAEFYLPAAVSTWVRGKVTNVEVIPTKGVWFGVTYREDKPRVQAALQELIRAGVYPAELWS